MRPSKPALGTILATTAMALALAACDRNQTQQPLSSADLALPATAALTSPGPLEDRYGPPPKKVPVGRVVNGRDNWAWADRSYALDSVFYDTAPDYGFYYDDYEPWVWQTSDRWAMYGDPYDYGYPYDDDYYYYYYQPGAVRPYFIRDDEYGYGFDDIGRLVVIYDLLGRIMPQSFLYEREPYASRYYQRAYLVRQASLRAQPVVVTQTVWLEQAPVIQRYQQRWIQAAQTQPQWVDYRQRTGDRFVRSFADDRRQREQRLQVANSAPQQSSRGFFTNPLGGRDRTAEPAQVAQNERRGFFGPGGIGRTFRRDQVAPAPPRRAVQAEQPRSGGLFGGGRDRQLEERALQRQAQADQTRRGFLNGRDRRAEQRSAQDQSHGRDRQSMARQQQDQQRQLQAQAQAENGRQRQEMMRQQRQAEAQARQEQARQRQETMRQQHEARAQARDHQQQAQARQAETQARQAQAQARQAEQAQARQQQAQQRQAQAQARQTEQAQARQQQDQQRQAQAQAQAQARQQQAPQAHAQGQKQAQQKSKNDEAQAADQNGRGHGKKS